MPEEETPKRGRGRPRREDVRRFKCPWPGHGRRDVVLHGAVKDKDGAVTRQRFMCSPGTKRAHTFSVPVGPDGTPTAVSADVALGKVRGVDGVRPYVPPEPCPDHPGSTVTRKGTYKAARGSRQRYLCTPVGWYEGASRETDPDNAKHVFTPVLPRAHVEGDHACAHCEELRAINRGDTVIARGHQATTGQVADALIKLASGDSYQDVGLWLRSQVRPGSLDDLDREVADVTAVARARKAQAKNSWRRAADLVELFAPVLWEDWLNQKAAKEAELPPDLGPRVVMVDDVPVFENANSRRRQKQRFAVLALGEVEFLPGPRGERDTRLRLLRAFPNHSANSYTLLLDELGYVPDFVIADGGKGIEPAVKALAERTGQDVRFITSAFHIRQSLRRALVKAYKAKSSFNPGDLANQVETFQVIEDAEAWERWWEQYERRLTAQGVPRSGWPVRMRKESYDRTLEQLRVLAPFPDIPRSTGPLEKLLQGAVKATLQDRGSGFGNLVRTNALLDLLVLKSNGYFDDRPAVMRALRADAITGDPANAGYVPPVRMSIDPGRDRSLLNEEVIDEMLRLRGIAPVIDKAKKSSA